MTRNMLAKIEHVTGYQCVCLCLCMSRQESRDTTHASHTAPNVGVGERLTMGGNNCKVGKNRAHVAHTCSTFTLVALRWLLIFWYLASRAHLPLF